MREEEFLSFPVTAISLGTIGWMEKFPSVSCISGNNNEDFIFSLYGGEIIDKSSVCAILRLYDFYRLFKSHETLWKRRFKVEQEFSQVRGHSRVSRLLNEFSSFFIPLKISPFHNQELIQFQKANKNHTTNTKKNVSSRTRYFCFSLTSRKQLKNVDNDNKK